MKRGGPLRRTTPLRRAPIRRSAQRSGRSGNADRVPAEVAEAVLARDQGCVAHRLGFALDVRCQGRPHVHHAVLRAQGGEHTMENLLTLCELHHHWAHNVDRAGANAAGVIRRRRPSG